MLVNVVSKFQFSAQVGGLYNAYSPTVIILIIMILQEGFLLRRQSPSWIISEQKQIFKKGIIFPDGTFYDC